jgi:hypothetical protein
MSDEFTLDFPDSINPVYGFRAWKYHNTHIGEGFPLVLRNVSGGRGVWWSSDDWTYASCQNPLSGMWAGQHKCPGPVPQIKCECGLYAYHDVLRLSCWLGRYVVGAVVGKGMSEYGVIRHGREGWRAEMARPIAFVRPRTRTGGPNTQVSPGNANPVRYYGTFESQAQGIIEQLAYRLDAKLFDTLYDMADWVREDSGYDSFWTKEDEARYLEEYNERMFDA